MRTSNPSTDSIKISAAPSRLTRRLLCVCCAAVIAGCAQGEFSDLRQYVDEVKARPAKRIPPLPEFETYESFVYEVGERRDPFRPKEVKTLAQGSGGSSNGLKPDPNRTPEALEAFPLDGLEFVGLMENDQETWALIKAPDNIIYRAQVGNHLGQNYGKITSVAEARVELVEIIEDGTGGWVKRDAAIALTE